MVKITNSVRLSEEATKLWQATAKQLGISKTAVLEMAMREFAEKHKVKPPK